MRQVALSDAAYAVVCGMVQPTDQVDSERVVANAVVWEEVRHAFPINEFEAAVKRGDVTYVFEGEIPYDEEPAR